MSRIGMRRMRGFGTISYRRYTHMSMHGARQAPRIARWSRAAMGSILIQVVLLSAALAADPLPSWNETASKAAIVAFVDRVTPEDSPDFVPPAERIAVFDNDGTLWAEQPLYFQFAFAIDRVKTLVPQHPEWQTQEPFQSILAGDMKTALAGGEKAIVELITATHSGMTTDEFATIVEEWIATAMHPVTGRLYTEMVYQPMLELLAYLRDNGFKTYIVSGGGIEFMRVFSERVYGIPPEQVIGSSGVTEFQINDGIPVIMRLPEVGFVDDKAGKPVAIQWFIGRRPIAAFGNSDGDLQMLQWVTAGEGPRFGLIVHHTDAAREWAYDRDSSIGHLDEALDAARQQDWVVVDMKDDWWTIYPTE
ncbi:MAG: HAD family hydrolase [Dongiaceae bacterium]